MNIKAVIFDWAGTTVDYGCFAPVAAIIETLADEGIDISADAVRQHMGMKKRDHLGEIFKMEHITDRFRLKYGREVSEQDIDTIYAKVEKRLIDSLPRFSTPICGILDVIDEIRAMGLKIGSTTGYTKEMMQVVRKHAAEQGYNPDWLTASDEMPAGRPAPWMCYENMKQLGTFPAHTCVKIGDTIADIKEGLNAGMWSVGIVIGGSEMGYTAEEADDIDGYTIMKKAHDTAERLYESGAHYVAVFNTEIPAILKKIDARLKQGVMPSAGEKSRVTEGESNGSVLRAFRNHGLVGRSKELVDRDAEVFITQALSSPCLDSAESCTGAGFTLSDGTEVLDFHGNGVHQGGFGNDAVKDAVTKQMDTLSFCPRRYTNEKAVLLAEKLINITNGSMAKVLYAPAATLAMSSAIKLAMKVTGKKKFLSAYGSFHGASLCALSAAGDAGFLHGISGFDLGENFLPYNTYTCMFGSCAECGNKCLKMLDKRLKENPNVAGVILEAVRCTTVHVPDSGYFRELDDICRKHGVLKIFDETATGLGKSGRWFAYQNFGIEPDMLVAGKGLGGGVMPLACLMIRDGLDGAGDISIGHYTHEKSPVACVAGLAAIEYVEKHNLLEKAVADGDYFASLLHGIKSEFSFIGDVRHLGLMAALELDKNLKDRGFMAEYVMYRSLERGLSFKVSAGSVLTLSPALTITKDEMDRAAETLRTALCEIKI